CTFGLIDFALSVMPLIVATKNGLPREPTEIPTLSRLAADADPSAETAKAAPHNSCAYAFILLPPSAASRPRTDRRHAGDFFTFGLELSSARPRAAESD